ncbi:MAG: calcium/sodium antiporter [Candidatus Magasanikbacteria bacterium]|nr:calcium/sodium antiporter [Candidatus Magasanikbacteria bacterium]MBT5820073.1 calcium/sodium antiporter [Candidatus Magasanikbacteria bacterium]
MLIPIALLLIGLVILIVGADIMVRGSASMAKRWGLSGIVIGLTVVAFGTSAPELFVSVLSAMQGTTELAVANIIGSNLANILLILGIGATIKTLKVKKGTTFKEIPFALLGILLVIVMGNDAIIDGHTTNALTRSDGIAFLGFFVIFLYYTYGMGKVSGEESQIDTYSWGASILMFLLGIAGLVVGGKIIVDNAILLASLAGMSEAIIGLTIIAIGTSLPELATTVVAVRKGHTDLAIGNAIGSNIFNVFWILGLTSTITPLEFNTNSNIDVLFTTAATFILFLVMFVGKKHKLTRVEGIAFISLYVGYIIFAIIR